MICMMFYRFLLMNLFFTFQFPHGCIGSLQRVEKIEKVEDSIIENRNQILPGSRNFQEKNLPSQKDIHLKHPVFWNRELCHNESEEQENRQFEKPIIKNCFSSLIKINPPNNKKLLKLHNSWESLWNIERMLPDHFYKIKTNINSSERLQKISRAEKLSEECKEVTSELTELMFLEIQGFGTDYQLRKLEELLYLTKENSKYPYSQQMSKETFRGNLGNLFFQKAKRLITDKDLVVQNSQFLLAYSYDHYTALRYVLGIVKFLFENKLIDEEFVRSIFQEETMVKEVVAYTKHQFKINHVSGSNEHWNWSYLKNLLPVLGRKEEAIFKIVFLIGEIEYYGQIFNDFRPSGEWRELSKNLLIENYFKKLEECLGIGNHETLIIKNEEIFKDQIKQIIQKPLLEHYYNALNARHSSGLEMMYSIFDLLLMIENEMVKGIVKEFIEYIKFPNFWDWRLGLFRGEFKLEDIFNLYAFSSQYFKLSKLISTYQKEVEQKKMLGLDTSQLKSTIKLYLKRRSHNKSKLKKLYLKKFKAKMTPEILDKLDHELKSLISSF